MRGAKWLTVLGVVGAALSGPLEARANPRTHVVAAGETLGHLALRYRVSVDALRAANHLPNDRILVGQRLRIAAHPTLRHRVVRGDTLRCLASRYRVSVAQLRADNPHARGRLRPGRVLTIIGGSDPREGVSGAHNEVIVQVGETLSEIALRHRVGVDQVLRANPRTHPDRLAAGQRLRLPTAAMRTHTVARGEHLSGIAERYRVTLDELRGWNPSLHGDRIYAGQALTVERRAASESVGHAYCGHLEGGVQLGRHPGYVLRNPARAYGTETTVRRIRSAFQAMRRRHPRAPRVRIHDLSLRRGGPMNDHLSHQSGRDADMSYYQRRGCRRTGCPMRDVRPRDFDARRQWALFHHWLSRNQVEAIFADRSLHAALYREAKRRGATPSQLTAWFQFPRPAGHRGGIIRHFPKHRDHFHIRFRCAPSEDRCR